MRGHPGPFFFRGSIYTTIMDLGPKRPSLLWFWGPNSIIVVYVDPFGSAKSSGAKTRTNDLPGQVPEDLEVTLPRPRPQRTYFLLKDFYKEIIIRSPKKVGSLGSR